MTLHKLVPSLASGLFLLLAACGGSPAAPAAPAPSSPRALASGDPSCPVTVPGTSVTVEDTDTGAALVFVTTSDVAELRKRVATMSQMHNDHHGAMGPLPDGVPTDHGAHADHSAHAGHDMGGGSEHAGHAGGMIGVHSKAAVAEIDGGARLVLTSGVSEVGKLQGELRMHAQHLASGTCEMGSH